MPFEVNSLMEKSSMDVVVSAYPMLFEILAPIEVGVLCAAIGPGIRFVKRLFHLTARAEVRFVKPHRLPLAPGIRFVKTGPRAHREFRRQTNRLKSFT
jgi:hypothetical protein